MKSILFLKYWVWLPKPLKFFIIGGLLGTIGFGLLYVLPYSEDAAKFLGILDFIALVFLLMGVVYSVYGLIKSFRHKKDVTDNKP